MKILLLNECHYPRGGADIVYLNTGRILESHGHEVHYFSIASKKKYACEDEKYFFHKSKNPILSLMDYFYSFKAAKALKRMIKEVHPDVAHIHLIWGVLTPSVLKVLKKSQVPIVHTAHDYLMCCPVNHFLDSNGIICERCRVYGSNECIKKRCYHNDFTKSVVMALEYKFRSKFFPPQKYFDWLIFVSHFSRNKHLEHSRLLSFIPNSVIYNCSNMTEPPTEANDGYFLYFGRLSDEKGVDILINAFLGLSDVRLKIVGGGPSRKQLEAMTEGAANIEFLGFKSQSELKTIIKGSKFVIIPSRCYENNPMTIVESYGYGRPVIGSRIGGIPEIIEDGKTGFSFEVGNVEELKQNINNAKTLSGTDYKKMCEESFKFYCRHFTEEYYYNQLVKIYETVVS